MHAHPHAQSNNLRVQVVLDTVYQDDADVVDHFRRIILKRRDPWKPFYIGATTRKPIDRFNLVGRTPHYEVYNGMIVGWVGNATDAKRIERLVIQMAHKRFPDHCVNHPSTGGEGISEGGEYASVYMCYGGRQTWLLGRSR